MNDPSLRNRPESDAVHATPGVAAQKEAWSLSRRDLLLGVASSGLLLLTRSTLCGQDARPADAPLIPTAPDGFPHPLMAAPAGPGSVAGLAGGAGEVPPRCARQALLQRRALPAWGFRLGAVLFHLLFLMLNDERFMDGRVGATASSDSWMRRRRSSAATTAWCSGTPTRASASTSATSSISTATCRAAWPGCARSFAVFQRRGVRVYIDYNPWDTGTRREGRIRPRRAGETGAEPRGRRHLPRHDEPGRGASFAPGSTPCGPAWCSKARARCRWRTSTTITSPGRSGSTTARCPACCGTSGSSAATCSTRSTAGTATTRRTAHRLDERQRHDGLGKRLRLLGRLERARPAILRAMLPIQRRVRRACSPARSWTPLVPTEQPGVYASACGKGELRLWTLVNRGDQPVAGALLTVDLPPRPGVFRPGRGRGSGRHRLGPSAHLAWEHPAARHRLLPRGSAAARLARVRIASSTQQRAAAGPPQRRRDVPQS